MKVLKILGLAALLLVAAVLILAANKPDSFRVVRSASIQAPPEKIFPLINDFRRWQAWSPWERIDPALKRSHSGAPSGQGAVYAWEGNGEVGVGRMEIVEAAAPSKVGILLDFVKPFEAHNAVDFTLERKGELTSVTWAMQGHTPYFGKVVHVFLDMDSMVGRQFEAGLANLKALAEK